jgi:hypothetical protein
VKPAHRSFRFLHWGKRNPALVDSEISHSEKSIKKQRHSSNGPRIAASGKAKCRFSLYRQAQSGYVCAVSDVKWPKKTTLPGGFKRI